MADLSVVKEFSMPPPMHFKEEGGASLSPDGSKFIAVRGYDFHSTLDAITGTLSNCL
jgi:hypothetical protein